MNLLSTLRPATLGEACGDDPSTVCRWVYEHTGRNQVLAEAADWLVGKPLEVALIVVGAWVLTRVVRRVLRGMVTRMIAAPVTVIKQLESRALPKVGVGSIAVDDPRRGARARSIAAVVSGTSSVVIWIVAAILIASVVEVDLMPLIAGAGVLSLAVAFGAQSLVKDCIAGLFMLMEDQYGIGDNVDLGEARGVVEKVSLRATVLRGADGTVWHVPNGQIQRVGNQSKLWSMAVVDVLVSHQADLSRSRQLMQEAAVAVCESPEGAELVLEPPTVLGVESVAVEGITLRILVKVQPGKQWTVQRMVREAVVKTFEANGVPQIGRPPWPVAPPASPPTP